MSKSKKIVVVLLSAIVIFCVGWLALFGQGVLISRKVDKPYPFYNDELAKQHLVAHAGGAIDGKIYTNSREAIEGSIKAGRKYVEIDLIKTSDGEYIAGHDWERINEMTGRKGDKPLSKQEFLSSKLYGKYTPMSIDDVAELMEKYPDWVMVVDKIRDLDYLHEHLPYHDRMIVQVFALHNYFKALQLGYKYPTLRLKGGRRGVKEIYKVLMDIGNVKSVILGEKSFNKNKEYIGQLHDKGITVILYGNPSYQIVDNPKAIKANLYKYVDLIDSDHLSKLD
ncbi:MAG: hypothetical protein E7004_07275 [Alphaproteobacteria bacterium]|nr:hypothetical protein [Alphaproteobacteria bacterium]